LALDGILAFRWFGMAQRMGHFQILNFRLRGCVSAFRYCRDRLHSEIITHASEIPRGEIKLSSIGIVFIVIEPVHFSSMREVRYS